MTSKFETVLWLLTLIISTASTVAFIITRDPYWGIWALLVTVNYYVVDERERNK